MDAIFMDYAADPQLGKLRENKMTSVKADYLSTWTCTHTPLKISFCVGAGIQNAVSIIVGNTKIIPIGEDIDSVLALVTLEDEIKSRKFLGIPIRDRHHETIAKSWPLKH